MICPFFQESDISDVTGPMICQACKIGFEIDDRGECVFADMAHPRLPMCGQVCTVCGLIQTDKRKSCMWCGTGISAVFH